MRSSGVLSTAATEYRYCGKYSQEDQQCLFDGEVDVWYDSEVQETWWICPMCEYEHELSFQDYILDIEDDWYQEY